MQFQSGYGISATQMKYEAVCRKTAVNKQKFYVPSLPTTVLWSFLRSDVIWLKGCLLGACVLEIKVYFMPSCICLEKLEVTSNVQALKKIYRM